MVERGIAPERWLQRRRVAQEAPVVGVGDLAGGEQKLVNPDTMHGLFVVLSRVAAHEEPSRRDGDQGGKVFFRSRSGKQIRIHGIRAHAARGRRLRFYSPGTSECRRLRPLQLPGTMQRFLW